ncbi:BON domain-containing protein, partial [Acinetobacter baumannii]
VHTEDGVLYVMGRLNTAEINDLNNVLQNVGNVTKIVTLIDNIDLAPTPAASTASATTTPVINNVLAQPTVQTPVAIDPDQTDPASSAQ